MASFPKSLPHGSLTTVADGVYCVRGAYAMGPGVVIGRTMTVIDSGDGLVVLNATRLSDSAQDELDTKGQVKHLVKLADSHFIDEPYYVDRYKPTLWTLPGAKLGNLTIDRTLGPDGPVEGGVVVDFGETKGWREAAYFVPIGGGTLVTCDAIQNCVDNDRASFLGRIMMSMMGFKGGVVCPPMWRRFQKVQGPQVAETLGGLLGLSFENLITGHGPPIAGGADAMVRAAVESFST